MDIKRNLFVSDLNYHALNTESDQNNLEVINKINEIKDFSDSRWIMYITFNVVGIEKLTNRNLNNDGIVVLTYSKLDSNELRFDGMQGLQMKNEDGIKKLYSVTFPANIDLRNIENVYIKILYMSNVFGDSHTYTDHFHYMLNDTENELMKFTFPLPLFLRGEVNE